MTPYATSTTTLDGIIGIAVRNLRNPQSIVGFVQDRVTPDGHNTYLRAICSTLGRNVRHRTSVYLNNRLKQDHRGIKGPIRCTREFKEHETANRFCREYDELRNFLRSRSRHNQYVPATRRRRHFLQHARIAIGIMQTARSELGPRDPLQTARDVTKPLIDREVTALDNKRLSRRLSHARLRQSAVIEDTDLRTPRGLDRALFHTLTTGGMSLAKPIPARKINKAEQVRANPCVAACIGLSVIHKV